MCIGWGLNLSGASQAINGFLPHPRTPEKPRNGAERRGEGSEGTYSTSGGASSAARPSCPCSPPPGNAHRHLRLRREEAGAER
uniref:Uncharacterized protein n=1 Tax=Arundo donax TaxID=35708 RepID=A0A0A9G258_ARUDO